MEADYRWNIRSISSNEISASETETPRDARERLLAISTEISKRAIEASSLSDLQFLLTNDIQVLIEFDRCILITHFGGSSKLVAINNQPIIDTKTKFSSEVKHLAKHLRSLGEPVLLSTRAEIPAFVAERLGERVKASLESYMATAGCSGLLCVPLNFSQETIGHLIFEYLGDQLPDQPAIMSVLKAAPFFAAALGQRWLLEEGMAVPILTERHSFAQKPGLRFLKRYLPLVLIIAAVFAYLFFVLPVPYTVGGEAEIVPEKTHVAFSKIDGLVEHIHIAEGTPVRRGQILASLDATEIDHKIGITERDITLLAKQKEIMERSAGEEISKLAESRLFEIRIKSKTAELAYLKWQRQFLDITAPVSGIVLTKKVDTLIGRKFRAGEAFCEIAVPGELCSEIYVPEDRVSQVKVSQNVSLYLNSDPLKAYSMKVAEISPRSETHARLGNIYRVRATFEGQPPDIKHGMKGIGKIQIGTARLWSIVLDRLSARWNQTSLYFW